MKPSMAVDSTASIFAKRTLGAIIGLVGGLLSINSHADDWGAYTLVPVSAPAMVLEAVDSGAMENTAVSINKPAHAPNQKWFIIPKGDGFYTIRPSYSSTLALAAKAGEAKNGTAIVLESDKGEPWQMWQIKKHDNGTYGLIPKHAPDKGIDDLGGKKEPGAKIDLWVYNPKDQHLQWLIKPLAGTAVTTAGDAGKEGAGYVPPAIQAEAILPGRIEQCAFNTSLIFPGTERDVTIFIPAQYDGSKPACVYVKTDGYNPREKMLMETMIATKEMPVTIGVFVRPGQLPAPMKGTVGRRNRDLEYDSVDDSNVRFLIDELLPFVARQYNLKLSTSGNDRCISGGSSGGIAAFTAAWHRPEAFSRVYCASGSFVAFRGGHEFPTMVRKFEAKPIRTYMTTGMRDMENCAGDWFLLDQEMDKALKFSGYDYFFRIIDGGHVAGYMDFYQEAMAYLWKGWPEPVKAGPSAPRAQDVLLPNENWRLVDKARHEAQGATSNSKGEIFFVDASSNQIQRISLDGKVEVFATDAGQANSLSFGSDGQLYTVSSHTGKVMSYDSAGKATLVIDGLYGHSILATPKGGLYVTTNEGKSANPGTVWWVKEGKKTRADAGLKFATGLAYRPDQWLLAVADGKSKWAYSYQINDDGTLTNKERFFWLHVADWEDDAGAEAICYGLEGQMFVATRSGIQICADDGPTQVILPMPNGNRVTSVCLGGKDLDTLFAFAGGQIWQRKVKTHAVGAFTPWTKVNGTKL